MPDGRHLPYSQSALDSKAKQEPSITPNMIYSVSASGLGCHVSRESITLSYLAHSQQAPYGVQYSTVQLPLQYSSTMVLILHHPRLSPTCHSPLPSYQSDSDGPNPSFPLFSALVPFLSPTSQSAVPGLDRIRPSAGQAPQLPTSSVP